MWRKSNSDALVVKFQSRMATGPLVLAQTKALIMVGHDKSWCGQAA